MIFVQLKGCKYSYLILIILHDYIASNDAFYLIIIIFALSYMISSNTIYHPKQTIIASSYYS